MDDNFSYLVRLCADARGLPAPDAAQGPVSQDESSFIAKAAAHKVLAAAYAGLAATTPGLSQSAMQRLRGMISLEKASRAYMLQEWQAIDAVCSSRGIPVLTVKGPAASLQLYGNAFTREYTDLDLIVPTGFLDKIGGAMAEAGYISPGRSGSSEAGHQCSSSRFVRRSHETAHLTFAKTRVPFRVEVRDTVFRGRNPDQDTDIEQLFSRSVAVSHDGHEFRTLCPADHAVLLLQHGARHLWSLLHWVLDAAVVMHRGGAELHREMARRIAGLGWQRELALAARLVRSLFPIRIPEPIALLAAPYAGSVEVPARMALERLGRPSDSVKCVLKFLWRYEMAMAQGSREKIQVLLKYLKAPEAATSLFPLPGPLQPLYLVMGPLFMASHRIRRAFAG